MERLFRLLIAADTAQVSLCTHITLGGFEQLTRAWTPYPAPTLEKWSVICHECGDVFNIEYEIDG